MGRQGRHLWGPRWAKRLFKRGSQNGIEKVIEKGSQNESFCDARIAKSVGRYCKSSVLRVQEKYQNLIENGSQNDTQKHAKWSHWRPWGGQWATLSPTLVDFEGSENRSIFEAPSGRQKVDGCSPWGRSGGKMGPRRFVRCSAKGSVLKSGSLGLPRARATLSPAPPAFGALDPPQAHLPPAIPSALHAAP